MVVWVHHIDSGLSVLSIPHAKAVAHLVTEEKEMLHWSGMKKAVSGGGILPQLTTATIETMAPTVSTYLRQ